MEICLNHCKWYVKGFWPWAPLKDDNLAEGKEMIGVTDWISAEVPGGVHTDLYRAGWIEHPYKDLNSLHCEWVENRWWLYRTTFDLPANLLKKGSKVELIFKGLDYHAQIYLNGHYLGEHIGMYTPAVFDITALVEEMNNRESNYSQPSNCKSYQSELHHPEFIDFEPRHGESHHPESFDLESQHSELHHPISCHPESHDGESCQLLQYHLQVLFRNAPDEMSQLGKTSLTHTQKSRFNYKWDFSTRLVNIGIWDDVLIKVYPEYSLEDLQIVTDVEAAEGLIEVTGRFAQNLCNARNAEDAEPLRILLSCYEPDLQNKEMITHTTAEITANTDADASAYTNADTTGNTDADATAYTNADTTGNTNADATAYTNADATANTNTDTTANTTVDMKIEKSTGKKEIRNTKRASEPILQVEIIPGPGGAAQLFKQVLHISNPKLWYPNGYGDQPLYQLKVQLFQGLRLLDEKIHQVGVRSLRFAHNAGSPPDAHPYTIVVNGKKVYVKGVNLTPLDHVYGAVKGTQYEHLVQMMVQANINLVRVWGGGLIEKEIFYTLCDHYGILIWQDFIQSSSGIDNIPSRRPEFLDLLAKTALNAVQTRRNHVSLAIWCGGNELMSAPNKPSDETDENIALLKRIVEEHDGQRLFLPTTASGPVEFVTFEKGVSHDIHGHWHYQGNPKHYELYGQSDSLFHSEFGVDGLSSRKSLRKFLDERQHYPTPMSRNPVWRHHGELWGTYFRDTELFGAIEDMDTFIECSQWVQAEGVRYIIEANRRRQFANSGSIVWQLNEPWPNVSCTNLIDYYGEPKMAYYWVRNAYAPYHVSLAYNKLNYAPGEVFDAELFAAGNYSGAEIEVTAEVLDVRGTILLQAMYSARLERENAVSIGRLKFTISPEFSELFFIRLKITNAGKCVFENLYIFSTRNELIYRPALALNGGESVLGLLEVIAVGEWEKVKTPILTFTKSAVKKRFAVKNTGNEVLLHIYPEENTDRYWLKAEESYFTLFPGESKEIDVICIEKEVGGFLKEELNEEIDRALCEMSNKLADKLLCKLPDKPSNTVASESDIVLNNPSDNISGKSPDKVAVDGRLKEALNGEVRIETHIEDLKPKLTQINPGELVITWKFFR